MILENNFKNQKEKDTNSLNYSSHYDHYSGIIEHRDFHDDTFSARFIKTPYASNDVDDLGIFAEDVEYGVEMHRRRRMEIHYRKL